MVQTIPADIPGIEWSLGAVLLHDPFHSPTKDFGCGLDLDSRHLYSFFYPPPFSSFPFTRQSAPIASRLLHGRRYCWWFVREEEEGRRRVRRVAFHESYWSALTRRESQSLSTQPAIRERENGALLDSQHPGRDSGREIFTLLLSSSPRFLVDVAPLLLFYLAVLFVFVVSGLIPTDRPTLSSNWVNMAIPTPLSKTRTSLNARTRW